MPNYYIPRNTYLGVPYRRDGDYDYYNASPENMPNKPGEHWSSRNPYTGKILKYPWHPTYNLAMEGEKEWDSQFTQILMGWIFF